MRPLLIFGWLAACAGMSAPVSRGPKAAMPQTSRAAPPRGPAQRHQRRRRPLTLETARHLLNKGALSHDDAVAAVRSATRLAQSPAPRHKTRPTRNDVDAFVRDVLNAPSRDWEPTERLCAVALDAHARDGDVKATRQLIRAARSLGGVQPGPVSFCILIKAVGRRGEKLPNGREKRTLTKSVDEAIKGCARNSVPDAVLLNAAVDAYARLGAVDDALHLVGSFGDYGVQADARAYNAALKALVKRPRDALALRRRMRAADVRPTAVTNATLINTIALHNPARAQRLLPTLVRDDFMRDRDALNAATAAYTSVVGAFASQGAERAAYDVAGLMRRRSVPLNAVTFAELFRAAATATKGSKRARRIRGLWRRLTKDRIRPTRGCYDVAIASLIGDVPDPACLRLALDLSATMRADVGWSTTTLNLILAALYASDARAKEARSTYDAPVASDRNAKLRAAERLFDRAERDPRTCAPPDCATYTIALRARARRGDLDGCRQAFRSLRDSPTLSVDNVAATSMLVALARAGALSEMWRLLEDMRNVEMCEDLPTPDADAVEVVVRALARARSGVAADKALTLYERHFGTRGDLGAPSEACVQAVLLACARKAPPPKGLFDLKRSVRDDVKAAREVLDGLEGRLPSDTVRDLRQYARETLAQCETETWRDGAGQRPGGRWTEPESASDRLFSQKGWNSVDSGFKLF